MSEAELPIGQRIAQLRMRRGMTQQVLADRLGRSKSWVEKVERGTRRLDRLSVIEAVAEVLGVAPEVLLGRKVRRGPIPEDVGASVDRVRATLACYDTFQPGGDGRRRDLPSTPELARRVGHAWEAYRHAHHPEVLRMLPDLLRDARHLHHATAPPEAEASDTAADLLVRVYRLAAQVLVKLGEANLAWLAADRAMAVAAGDLRRTAAAAIALAQALRALHRGQLALAAAVAAAHRLAPPPSPTPAPRDLALVGTLLIEAALAASSYGDAYAATDFVEYAARLAKIFTDQSEPDGDEVGFGPVAVDLARARIAADLGEHRRAITAHQRVTDTDGWRKLPAEHRAAHLIDVSRAHLNLGNAGSAGHALVTADRIAPAEVRIRPVAHAALTAVLRAGRTSADVNRLITAVGLAQR